MIVTNKPLVGETTIPASKSAVHRLLFLAAQAQTPVTIKMSDISRDIAATMQALTDLGLNIAYTGEGVTVSGGLAPTGETHIEESGTTLRLLLPLLCTQNGRYRVTLGARLKERPILPLMEVLNAHGGKVTLENNVMEISGMLAPGRYCLPGHISSQFISGLLLVLWQLNKDSEIHLKTALVSWGYVKLTQKYMTLFGLKTEDAYTGFNVKGRQKMKPQAVYEPESCWSCAAPFLLMAAYRGDVTLKGMNIYSHQPDKLILDVLKQTRAEVTVTEDFVRVRHQGPLRFVHMDVDQCPDLAPVLAGYAALIFGQSNLIGLNRLKYKETDRLAAIRDMLDLCHVRHAIWGETLLVHGARHQFPTAIACPPDHRLVMMAAVMAQGSPHPIELENAHHVEKSFPRFFDTLYRLQGEKDDGIRIW